VALADFSNSGTLAAVVANEKGPVLLYKNHVDPQNKWIEFSLTGRNSNRSAIGAEVRVFWNGQQQVQEVSGGSGFCSQNSRTLHFGLGKTTAIERVEIRWPSGRVQKITSPELNRIHRVQEPA
jgi:enediyne biosynthesis protein E4